MIARRTRAGCRCGPPGSTPGAAASAVAARFDARARERGGAVRAAPPDGIGCAATGCGSSRRSGAWSTTRCGTAAATSGWRWSRATGVVELHVRDDGPGFAPGFLDRAFERFARADGDRSRGGSGLGLAIVAAIAASHGGCARAANPPAGGADVWLELPAAAGAGGRPGPQVSEPGRPVATATARTARRTR